MSTKKSAIDFFFTKEKWNEMNFKNVILKVFEDEREGGGRKKSKKSERKWARSGKG